MGLLVNARAMVHSVGCSILPTRGQFNDNDEKHCRATPPPLFFFFFFHESQIFSGGAPSPQAEETALANYATAGRDVGKHGDWPETILPHARQQDKTNRNMAQWSRVSRKPSRVCLCPCLEKEL